MTMVLGCRYFHCTSFIFPGCICPSNLRMIYGSRMLDECVYIIYILYIITIPKVAEYCVWLIARIAYGASSDHSCFGVIVYICVFWLTYVSNNMKFYMIGMWYLQFCISLCFNDIYFNSPCYAHQGLHLFLLSR